MPLFAELKRRRVFRAMAVYLVVAWAMIQVADTIAPNIGLPQWTVTLVILLAALGLPIALVFAWLYDVTPDGVERAPIAATSSTRIGALIAVAAITVLVGAGAYWRVAPRGTPKDVVANNKSIAVLPFANLSTNADDAFFADGIHDEILTHLAHIAALDVRSRTSMLEYKQTQKNLKTIASELGVRFILEGSVRRAGGQTRITAQLIDALTDKHMWAETFDDKGADVFALQTSVAQKIAESLQAQLTGAEQTRLKARPTENAEAYDLFLQAKVYNNRGDTRAYMETALQLTREALTADPKFAEAHVLRSNLLGKMYWFYYDRSDSIRTQMLRSAERALELDPNLPESHHALGLYYYRVELNYDKALEKMRTAQHMAPGLADISFDIAAVLRRKGDMQASIASFERARQLSPLYAAILLNKAETHALVRELDKAQQLFDQARNLAPDQPDVYTRFIPFELRQRGDITAARALMPVLRNLPEEESEYTFLAARINYWDRKPDAALATLTRAAHRVYDDQFAYTPRTEIIARIYREKGDLANARRYYDSAMVIVNEELAKTPEDGRLHMARALTLAGLGRKDEAIAAARRATELMPVSKDAWRGAVMLAGLAQIYAMVGEPDRAIELLDRLLHMPSDITVPRLRIDPAWDSLRDNPRFQAFLKPG